ncbi:MAG: hypothetical protein J0M33_23885 [Anaerolineae bacterium]|nr:hypothetical protein [Anaerolineae bacterium]
MSNLSDLRMLDIEQRQAARQRARLAVVAGLGEQPNREAYVMASVSQYPRAVNRLVLAGMVVVFIAAALPSFFRLFAAGRDTYLQQNPDAVQAALVGVATFILAEFLVIVSTLTMRVYFTGRGQLVMAIPITLGICMALVGNWHVAQPHDLFGWLETLTPPLAVLFMALIGERLILDAIHQRTENERAYQKAAQEWQQAQLSPEQSPQWKGTYATVLRDELIRVNRRLKAGQTAMAAMTTADWKAAVYREMAAENWFETDANVPAPVVMVDEVPPSNDPLPGPVAMRLAAVTGD